MNTKAFISFSILAILLWLVGAMLLWNWDRLPALPQRGQFGDMFGALTSLFSVLGFIGILYTLHEQQIQMKNAQDTAERSQQASVLPALVELMNDKEFLEARARVLDHGILASEWDANAGHVVSRFNTAGILCNTGYVDTAIVLAIYGLLVKTYWNELADHVKEKRGVEPEYGVAFEWLAGMMDQVHPSKKSAR